MSNSKKEIPVVLGTTFKREAVLINPAVTAADNDKTGEVPSNILAEGENTQQLMAQIYGKR